MKGVFVHDLPGTDISQLLQNASFNIETGGDKRIDDALIIIERKLSAGEIWQAIILHREKGMLLLKDALKPGYFTGLWLKTPTCGDDSRETYMTSYILGRIGVGTPTEALHENFVSKCRSVLFRDINGPRPSREPF